MIRKWIVAATTVCALRARLTVGIGCAVALIATMYVIFNFSINTDSAQLISPQVPWRQRAATFDAAFAQRTNLIAIVIDGATAELAEQASAQLSARLAARTDLFQHVSRPDGGPFFERNGLLFLSTAEVARTTEQLIAAQPLLGSLASDPSIRGLMAALRLALTGVASGDTTLDTLKPALTALANTAEDVQNGRPGILSWQSLLGGGPPDPRALRRFVLVQPVLDFTALQPGERATQFIRAEAKAALFNVQHGVRVRLTGDVPMADEEFGTLAEHAQINIAAMTLGLLVMLWLAVRSLRVMAAIIASLLAGLALSAALGLAIYGSFNLISVAFAVLFVGLGVDFGIQYAVSYLAHAREDGDALPALREAAQEVGAPLAWAALAIAAGFFAFEPTLYLGISELGVIAGVGMLIAFTASITLLPALLRLMPPRGVRGTMDLKGLAGVDRFLAAQRKRVLIVAAVFAIGSLSLLPFLRFDFNPLHLRSSTSEAVATVMDLAKDPLTSPDTIDVLTPSLEAARTLAQKLAALPAVAQALTLASFIPEDQESKLALIADAAFLLQPALEPTMTLSAPQDAQTIAAMLDCSSALKQAAARDSNSDAAQAALRFARALDALARGPLTQRAALAQALIPGLQTTLAQIRNSLQAEPVSISTLPQDLTRDWIAQDGRARVEVFPRRSAAADAGNATDTADIELQRFISAVSAIAPEATGAPISIAESAQTIVHAFVQAGVWALLAITVLLALVLRRASDVLRTLASLLLGGLVTLGLCVLLHIQLNYENIIALPLLFGIGVAFNIYFVIAWRKGCSHLLQTSIARAVIFSALTTATAFGSLWLSSHPGTASMGKLLALSLACTLAAALLVLPALLGPAPKAD